MSFKCPPTDFYLTPTDKVFTIRIYCGRFQIQLHPLFEDSFSKRIWSFPLLWIQPLAQSRSYSVQPTIHASHFFCNLWIIPCENENGFWIIVSRKDFFNSWDLDCVLCTWLCTVNRKLYMKIRKFNLKDLDLE